MKKVLTIGTSILFILLATGCSNTKKITSVKSASAQTVSIYYQDLSKTDKKKLKFKFSEAQDETADNYADPVYVISVKITNKTNKTVKFDKSKFLVFTTEQTKFTSNKTGILTLKPGQSKSINQLIEGVAEQSLVGGGSYFIYLNKDNKLAEANFAKPPMKNSKKQTASSTVAKSTGTDNTQSSQGNDQSSNQGNYPTESEALATLKAAFNDNFDTSKLTPTRGNSAWLFDDNNGQSWAVFDNGSIKAPGDPEPVFPSSDNDSDTSDDSDTDDNSYDTNNDYDDDTDVDE